MIRETCASIKNHFLQSFYALEHIRAPNSPIDINERMGDLFTSVTKFLLEDRYALRGSVGNVIFVNSDCERLLIYKGIIKVAKAILFVLFLPIHTLGFLAYEFSISRQAALGQRSNDSTSIQIEKLPFQSVFGELNESELVNFIEELKAQLKFLPLANEGHPAQYTVESDGINVNQNGVLSNGRLFYANYSIQICRSGKVYFFRKAKDSNSTTPYEIKMTVLPNSLKKNVRPFPLITLTALVNLASDSGVCLSNSEDPIIFPPFRSTARANYPLISSGDSSELQQSLVTWDDSITWAEFTTSCRVKMTMTRNEGFYNYNIPQEALRNIEDSKVSDILNEVFGENHENKCISAVLKIPEQISLGTTIPEVEFNIGEYKILFRENTMIFGRVEYPFESIPNLHRNMNNMLTYIYAASYLLCHP